MSGNWTPAGDGIYEYQQETGPKPDGTLTVSIREIGQTTRYPHINFDYHPDTGELTYNHESFSKRKHFGMREIEENMGEIVETAIAYLKGQGLL